MSQAMLNAQQTRNVIHVVIIVELWLNNQQSQEVFTVNPTINYKLYVKKTIKNVKYKQH